jgi:hypothetical protein
MTFSGALVGFSACRLGSELKLWKQTLTDLNDFITPSQACIKPVEQVKPKILRDKEPGAANSEILIDGNGAYYEFSQDAGPGRKLEQAQISLNDCLACRCVVPSFE